MSMAEDYYYHLRAHRHSLLARIVGCHALRMHKNTKVIYFVVMQNVAIHQDPLAEADLKGSWLNREQKNTRAQQICSRLNSKGSLDYEPLTMKVCSPTRQPRQSTPNAPGNAAPNQRLGGWVGAFGGGPLYCACPNGKGAALGRHAGGAQLLESSAGEERTQWDPVPL